MANFSVAKATLSQRVQRLLALPLHDVSWINSALSGMSLLSVVSIEPTFAMSVFSAAMFLRLFERQALLDHFVGSVHAEADHFVFFSLHLGSSISLGGCREASSIAPILYF